MSYDKDDLTQLVERINGLYAKAGGTSWSIGEDEGILLAAALVTAWPQMRRALDALRLAAAWIESEEGNTLQYVVESDDRAIARNGKGAWNSQFSAMARAVTAVLSGPTLQSASQPNEQPVAEMEALRELVRLKDERLRIEDAAGKSISVRDAWVAIRELEEQEPAAWSAARAALSSSLQATEQMEALRKNAARYEWLRVRFFVSNYEWHLLGIPMTHPEPDDPSHVDAAIDAAISSAEREKQNGVQSIRQADSNDQNNSAKDK